MDNTWIGITPNIGLEVYDIESESSDDISGKQLLTTLIDATNSNATKIDEAMQKTLKKPTEAVQGNIAQFDEEHNVVDSGKNIDSILENLVQKNKDNAQYIKFSDGETLQQKQDSGELTGTTGKDGADGYSPTVEVATNTPDEYTLSITTVDGEVTTPNLKVMIKIYR